MKKLTSVAVGAAVAVTLSATTNAAENPFGMQELSTGYNVAMSEGTCGGDKAKDAKCGANKAKDAKCGANKTKEAKCGANKAKEAKCGASK